jgi:Exostosin family
MNIHLVCLRTSAFDMMVELQRKAVPQLHKLVQDPESADIILFVGGWGNRGAGVVDSPLPRKYPNKTFIYRDDDGFVPLLPGVYSSAEKPRLFNLKRVESQKYIESLNPNVKPLDIEKKYLFSFVGGSTSLLRKKLYKMKFKRSDVLVQNTSDYYHWDSSQPGREDRQKQYAMIIASSYFGLSPRGASAGSFRLFELMEMGVAPVILSDRFLLPEGPNWHNFALRVPESKIKKLDMILAAHLHEADGRGRMAREAYDEWFATPKVFNHIIAACERIRANRRISERWVQPFWGLMLWRARVIASIRKLGKNTILWMFKILGKRFVYEMNTR